MLVLPRVRKLESTVQTRDSAACGDMQVMSNDDDMEEVFSTDFLLVT